MPRPGTDPIRALAEPGGKGQDLMQLTTVYDFPCAHDAEAHFWDGRLVHTYK
jgi:hypothetical protein